MKRFNNLFSGSDNAPATSHAFHFSQASIPSPDRGISSGNKAASSSANTLLPPPSSQPQYANQVPVGLYTSVGAVSNPPSPSAHHPNAYLQLRQIHSASPSPAPDSVRGGAQQYFDYIPVQQATTAMAQPGFLTSVQNIAIAPTQPASLYAQSQAGLPSPSSAGPSVSAPQTLDRNELHKSLKALEGLLVSLDEYRDLSQRMAKVEKKIARGANDLGKGKAVKEVPSQTLQTASNLFEALNDVSSKHAKLVQREYESLNEACAKYFKRIAKEERAHDELVDGLDTKVKKAGAAHDKNTKSKGYKAVESHDRYIATITALTSDIAKAKSSHAASVTAKQSAIHLIVASSMGALADAEFRQACESVRKTGPNIGKLNEWLNFAMNEAMPSIQPPDLGDDEPGPATLLATAEAQAIAASRVSPSPLSWAPPTSQAYILQAQPTQAALAVPAPASVTFANLPTLNSDGQLVSEAPEPSRTPVPSVHAAENVQPSSDEKSSPNVSHLAASPQPTPPAQDAGHRAQGSAEAPRATANAEKAVVPAAEPRPKPDPAPAAGTLPSQREVQTDTLPSSSTLSANSRTLAPVSSVSPPSPVTAKLGRSPTGNTTRSMAVTPEVWEESVEKVGDRTNFQEETARTRQRSSSSAAEGTVLERRDDSDATPSLSNSRLSSEGSSAMSGMRDQQPSTPSDNDYGSAPPLTYAAKNQGQGLGSELAPIEEDRDRYAGRPLSPALSKREAYGSSLTQELDSSRDISPQGPAAGGSAAINVEGQMTRYVDAAEPRYLSTPPAADLSRPPTSPGPTRSQATDEAQRAKEMSLWEREREREREIEREKERELYRRSGEKDRLLAQERERESMPLRPVPRTGVPSPSYRDVTPRFSSSGNSSYVETNRAGVGSSAAYPRGQESLNESRSVSGPPVYDPDRYAPAVGGSKLSGVSVSRTLSQESTASERSFVARMKARYQEEKERAGVGMTQGRWEEKQSRRVTLPASPPPDLPSNSRRVSDLASQYGPMSLDPQMRSYRSDRDAYDRDRSVSGHSALRARAANYASAGGVSGAAGWEDQQGSQYSARSGTSGAGYGSLPLGRGLMGGPSPQRPSPTWASASPGEFGNLRNSLAPPGQQGQSESQSQSQGQGQGQGRQRTVSAERQQRYEDPVQSAAQPHSDVCGCHSCSARHYGGGGGGSANSGPPASSSTGSARRLADGVADPREWTVRRQSLPPPRDEREYQGSSVNRRSFEDARDQGAERHVAFVAKPETIR